MATSGEAMEDSGNTGVAQENGSSESFKENSSSEPVKENGSSEPAKENGSSESVTENGSSEPSKENGTAEEITESRGSPKAVPKSEKTVEGILTKIREDKSIADSEKVTTLCFLLQRIIEENSALKSEVVMIGEHMKKTDQAKEAIKMLNEAYKKQIGLVREESELKLQEEACRRAECVNSYQTTMSELAQLLETHTGQNSRLRDENTGMADQLRILLEEGKKREDKVTNIVTEYELRLKLLEHQVSKAQIEKAEVKADLTKERLEIYQELTLERERSANLEETVRLLKEQASIYQAQLDDLSSGAGNNTKTFQHFKTQIDKLTKQMAELDKDTHQWREKYEVSSQQVKKMNAQSLEREKELGQLKKKLESMVKLNKTLSKERQELIDKLKTQEGQA